MRRGCYYNRARRRSTKWVVFYSRMMLDMCQRCQDTRYNITRMPIGNGPVSGLDSNKMAHWSNSRDISIRSGGLALHLTKNVCGHLLMGCRSHSRHARRLNHVSLEPPVRLRSTSSPLSFTVEISGQICLDQNTMTWTTN